MVYHFELQECWQGAQQISSNGTDFPLNLRNDMSVHALPWGVVILTCAIEFAVLSCGDTCALLDSDGEDNVDMVERGRVRRKLSWAIVLCCLFMGIEVFGGKFREQSNTRCAKNQTLVVILCNSCLRNSQSTAPGAVLCANVNWSA